MGKYWHSYCVFSAEWQFDLRRWQPKLRNRMTKEARESFRATAKAVVKKGKKKDGTTSVSDT